MKRFRTILLLAPLALAVTFSACAKKKPQAPPPAPPAPVVQPAQPTEDVTPRTQGEVVDKTPNPLAGDIAAVNDFVSSNALLGDVYFDFDKSDLSEDARARLAKNADWLNAHPEFQVTIEGHCDERGTNEYNLALGARRADAARDYIASLGVSASRLRTISYGEERPVCTDHDEGCWSRNRRAHFLITGRASG